MLYPQKNIHKYLLSTPVHIVGEYSSEDILITHSWPDIMTPSHNNILKHRGDIFPSYLVAVLDIENNENDSSEVKRMPNYHYYGEMLSVSMTILFGKLFIHHGMIETNGLFSFPTDIDNSKRLHPSIEPFLNEPRKDIPIELNLVNFELISPLFKQELNINALKIFYTAGLFYVRSLQMIEVQPEIAFVDLVTTGEILSNFYNFPEELLYDTQTKILFDEILEYHPNPNKAINIIKNRFYQVRRKYTLTLLNLLNDHFFYESESTENFLRLTKENIEDRIKASYDLRSKYVHSGVEFGRWIYFADQLGSEIMLGEPAVDDNDYKKILVKSPTYIGLERMMRFCLLRFLHHNLCKIDDKLN